MNISQFCTIYKISIDTLRFYEKNKLIQPQRLQNGYRNYLPKDEETIKLILCLKKMGFSLKEIQFLVKMEQNHISEDCKLSSSDFLLEKIKSLKTQITFLLEAKKQLTYIQKYITANTPENNKKYIKQTINSLYPYLSKD